MYKYVFLLLLGLITACEDDKIAGFPDCFSPGGNQLCATMDISGEEATIDIMQTYIDTCLSGLSTDDQYPRFASWLESKPCIREANIICIRCIETLPPQTEIEIRFVFDGQEFTRILDISDNEQKLTVLRFHA